MLVNGTRIRTDDGVKQQIITPAVHVHPYELAP
jgi:hypothetical protein